MQTRRRTLLAIAAIQLIRIYRNSLSLIMIDSCRFFPSCSEYAEEALRRHGTLRGGWMTARRLLRCHPLGRCGVDPVAD